MEFLLELENLLKQRKQELPENSYTARLFTGGQDRILKKIGEEAGEVIIAAKNDNESELLHEMADLLFHMQVLMVEKKIEFQQIADLLQSRHSQ